MTTSWLDTPAQWEAAAEAALRAGVMGLDTETYGHDVKTSSPAHRASIDVWSIALATSTLSPRGYHVARGAVLPAVAIDHPAWRRVLTSGEVLLVLHNAGHDRHALDNRGVPLGRLYDTLEAARLLWPGRMSYALKPLRVDLLGKQGRELFKELTAPEKRMVPVDVVRHKDVTLCSCGTPGCKKKKAHKKAPWEEHTKTKTRQEWTDQVLRERTFPVGIETIVPGHPRFKRKLDYAGDDAVDGLELYELCVQRAAYLDTKLPRLPW